MGSKAVSRAQLGALRVIEETGCPSEVDCEGRDERARLLAWHRRERTLVALLRKGLVNSQWEVTAAGREALKRGSGA